jgi:hypothetical protein
MKMRCRLNSRYARLDADFSIVPGNDDEKSKGNPMEIDVSKC